MVMFVEVQIGVVPLKPVDLHHCTLVPQSGDLQSKCYICNNIPKAISETIQVAQKNTSKLRKEGFLF